MARHKYPVYPHEPIHSSHHLTDTPGTLGIERESSSISNVSVKVVQLKTCG